MFNLEDEIKKWRAGFLKDDAFSKDNINELEAHLIDVYEAYKSEGIKDDDAFRQAVKTLGQRKNLRSDYYRVKPLQEKIFVFARAFAVCAALLAAGYALVWIFNTTYAPRTHSISGGLSGYGYSLLFTRIALVLSFLLGISFIQQTRFRVLAFGFGIFWVGVFLFDVHYGAGAVKFFGRPDTHYIAWYLWTFISGVATPFLTVFAVLLLSIVLKGKQLWYATVGGVCLASYALLKPLVMPLVISAIDVETWHLFNFDFVKMQFWNYRYNLPDPILALILGYGLSQSRSGSENAGDMRHALA